MTSPVERREVVIVGAGSAGLATGAVLRQAGLEPLLLEAGPEPGAAWRERYDRLRLHTPRLLSSLPGRRIPREYGRWVARDDLLEYFRDYAEAHALEVRAGCRVERIDRDDGVWRLETAQGPLRATTVIVATGYNGRPFVPDWPGRESFAGELVHSAEYRNPEPYRGRDVLVVGAGNSGAEIATDVADGGAARSRLSVRTPPQIVRRATAGIPAQLIGMAIRRLPPDWVDPISKTLRRLSIADLSAQGLPRPEHGVRTSFITTGTTPILDVGVVDAVRRGRVEVVAAVEGLDGPDVLLADGSRIQPDAVDPISKTLRRLSIADLSAQGLPRPEHGVRTSFITTGTTPILDVGVVDAVRRGRVEVVAAVEGLDGPDVLLADGSRIQPDA